MSPGLSPLLIAILAGQVHGRTVLIVADEGASACDPSELEDAISARRPELSVTLWTVSNKPRPPGSIVVQLEQQGKEIRLHVDGTAHPVVRSLPGGNCHEAIEAAAWIVDTALEEVAETPPAEPRSSRPWRVETRVAGGAEQGANGFSPSFALGGRVSSGRLCADLDLEGSLPSSVSLLADGQGLAIGTETVTEFSSSLAGGLRLHLGPIDLAAEFGGGARVAWDWVTPSVPALTNLGEQAHLEGFLLLRTDVTLPLSERAFVGIRLEERLVPATTSFIVSGASPTLTTPEWAFGLWLFAGYALY